MIHKAQIKQMGMTYFYMPMDAVVVHFAPMWDVRTRNEVPSFWYEFETDAEGKSLYGYGDKIFFLYYTGHVITDEYDEGKLIYRGTTMIRPLVYHLYELIETENLLPMPSRTPSEIKPTVAPVPKANFEGKKCNYCDAQAAGIFPSMQKGEDDIVAIGPNKYMCAECRKLKEFIID